MHVLDHLMEEHRKAERLLERLAHSEPGTERNEILDELGGALTLHMTVEEMFLYPIAAEVLDPEQVQEADVEHGLARDGLARLRALAAQPGFGAAVDMVTAGVAHHVREEETELFPELRRRAGDRLEEMDPESLESQARAAEADQLTRDELYERAKAADIPGRSQMTKRELATALRGRT